jgi:calnexin
MCSFALSPQVHFILRHQNPVTGKWEEKHAKNPPAIKGDQKTHLYTLVIRPDNSFEIFIDNQAKLTLHGLKQYYLKIEEE